MRVGRAKDIPKGERLSQLVKAKLKLQKIAVGHTGVQKKQSFDRIQNLQQKKSQLVQKILASNLQGKTKPVPVLQLAQITKNLASNALESKKELQTFSALEAQVTTQVRQMHALQKKKVQLDVDVARAKNSVEQRTLDTDIQVRVVDDPEQFDAPERVFGEQVLLIEEKTSVTQDLTQSLMQVAKQSAEQAISNTQHYESKKGEVLPANTREQERRDSGNSQTFTDTTRDEGVFGTEVQFDYETNAGDTVHVAITPKAGEQLHVGFSVGDPVHGARLKRRAAQLQQALEQLGFPTSSVQVRSGGGI